MYTKISVLIPTRRRMKRLRTLIDSFRATSCGSAELVFRVDDDDAPTREMLEAEGFEMVIGPRLRGYASLPLFFNELVAVAQGDVLMCGNDDMVFVTPGWATALLLEADNYPDGLFDLGVTTHNETHFPFACVSRKAVKTLGFIADPDIFWVDIYLRDVMAHFGKCVMVPGVRINHDWAGNAPDDTFNEYHRDPTRDVPGYWTLHAAAVLRGIQKLEAAR